MTDADLQWLAGLIEGEGCFSVHPRGGGPEIRVQMQDLDVVQRVAELFGSRPVYTLKKRKLAKRDSYVTTIRGSSALDLMKRLYPLMGARRKERIGEIIF